MGTDEERRTHNGNRRRETDTQWEHMKTDGNAWEQRERDGHTMETDEERRTHNGNRYNMAVQQ